jgi:hypothetical protein
MVAHGRDQHTYTDMYTDSESMKKTCDRFFLDLGKNPGTWWLSALRLREAADTLRNACWPKERKHNDLDAAGADFRLGPVYMLLVGMAVEAALKATLVAKQTDLVSAEGISKSLTNHHLVKLWNLAGLGRPGSRQRDSLLDRLENCVVVFGRYPVPKRPDGMNKMMNSSFEGQLHFDQVARLWADLEKHVRKTIPELFNGTIEGP